MARRVIARSNSLAISVANIRRHLSWPTSSARRLRPINAAPHSRKPQRKRSTALISADTSKPHNEAEKRVGRRAAEEQTGKQQVVVVMRERNGRTLPFVYRKESDAIPAIRERISVRSTVHADESRGWDTLHAFYDMRRTNHSVAFSKDGACTNQAESYFSRLRRAEIGTHHRISGQYLNRYAPEMAWREDHRRRPAARAHPHSRNFRRYWQCARWSRRLAT